MGPFESIKMDMERMFKQLARRGRPKGRKGTVNKYHKGFARTPEEVLRGKWILTRQIRRAELRSQEYARVRQEFSLPRRVGRAIARTVAARRFRQEGS